MEWWDIMARMYERSSTVAWLRTSPSASAKTIAPPAKIAVLTFLLLYMPSMKLALGRL